MLLQRCNDAILAARHQNTPMNTNSRYTRQVYCPFCGSDNVLPHKKLKDTFQCYDCRRFFTNAKLRCPSCHSDHAALIDQEYRRYRCKACDCVFGEDGKECPVCGSYDVVLYNRLKSTYHCLSCDTYLSQNGSTIPSPYQQPQQRYHGRRHGWSGFTDPDDPAKDGWGNKGW